MALVGGGGEDDGAGAPRPGARDRPVSHARGEDDFIMMTARQRFRNVLDFKPVDRLPMYEWAPYWDKTLERWRAEGMPQHLAEPADVARYFGLGVLHEIWISPRLMMDDETTYVTDMAGYERRRQTLYPADPLDSMWHISDGRWQQISAETVRQWRQAQARGDAVIALWLEGWFWYPRTLMGVERHLLAFHDLPDLLQTMNRDLCAYNLRSFDRMLELLEPDMVALAEDMSYNHGPMLSRDHFETFMAPYYRQLTAQTRKHAITCTVDSDGDISTCVSWFTDAGVDGFEPLERQAGVDIVELRRRHPRLRIMGAFDKMTMPRGEAAMRQEFERILPVMRQGGFIPSVDHQTPPGVSLENYRIYVALLEEYCTRAVAPAGN